MPPLVLNVTIVTTMQPKLLVVGGGRMGSALVRGLVNAHWSPGDVVIVETSAERRSELAHELPDVEVSAEVVAADGAVVAVKPMAGEEACVALAGTGTPRVLSIMAGVPLARLESWLPRSTGVIRAMPNTAAMVGAGVSAIAGGWGAAEPDLA